MRRLIFAAAAFGTLATVPAMAQGCGMMQQAAGQTMESEPATSGMMCGGAMDMGQSAAQPERQTQAAGGCPCCAKMAMMNMPAEGGTTPMPGMEMPETDDAPSMPPAE